MISNAQVVVRLCIGATFLFTCIYMNTISQVLIEHYYKPQSQKKPLFDISFTFLPYLKYPKVTDLLLVFLALSILGPLLIFHPERSTVARRYLAVQGIVKIFRSFSIIVTILPNPDKTCITDPIAGTPDENIFFEALRAAVRLRVTCGDCLFSGHAAMVQIFALTGHHFARGKVPQPWLSILRAFIWIYAGFFHLSLLATRFHYTIDVAVAMIVATAVWKWYGSQVKRIHSLPKWHPIAWYEADAGKEGYMDAEESQKLI